MLQNYLSPPAYRSLQVERLRRKAQSTAAEEWETRLRQLFPRHFTLPFSQPHRELGAWADAIEPETSPRPFVAIWPRSRGKSTVAEAVTVDLGARKKRVYCMYVCETQDQADKHVATIGHMMVADEVGRFFPAVGRPLAGKNGSRTWNRTTIRAENGFTVEAVGLDKAVRGQKIDWARPDLIVLDDIDAKHDTAAAVEKKMATIRTSILPAGSPNCAVLFVQNLIHRDSIATKLSKRPDEEGAADFLADRQVSGPHPSVRDLEYKLVPHDDGTINWEVKQGVSLWEGFGLDVVEDEINRWGPDAFETESQHDVDADNPNALLTSAVFDATRVSSHPDLIRLAVAVDPSGGAGQCGIVAGGVGMLGRQMHGFTVADASTPLGTPSSEWAEAALRLYHALQADCIVAEVNFGGDMVKATIQAAELRDADGTLILSGKNVPVIILTASRGKMVRAQPVSTLFQTGKWHHVGRFPELQKQWTRWVPGDPSPDRLDAEVWLATWSGVTAGASKPPEQPAQSSRFRPEQVGASPAPQGSRFKKFG